MVIREDDAGLRWERVLPATEDLRRDPLSAVLHQALSEANHLSRRLVPGVHHSPKQAEGSEYRHTVPAAHGNEEGVVRRAPQRALDSQGNRRPIGNAKAGFFLPQTSKGLKGFLGGEGEERQ